MSHKPISQREARRLRKRVTELEDEEDQRLNRWASNWVGGTMIAAVTYGSQDFVPVAIRTARLLRHAVVATVDANGRVSFYALPHAGGQS